MGLQEVEGKDEVWARLAAAAGGYRFDYIESADARDITVGILYDPQRVTVKQSGAAQGCGTTDFGVDYQHARGERAEANPCATGYPVFDRPPYVADLTIRSESGDAKLDLRVIVNHFKSRRGDETENLPQRLAQADHLAQLLEGPHRIALGDLNDTPDSATLQRLAAFADLYETHTLRADAYTYIYNGLAESPDYVIVSTDLLRYIKAAGPVHINADFPDLLLPDRSSRRSSDHDPSARALHLRSPRHLARLAAFLRRALASEPVLALEIERQPARHHRHQQPAQTDTPTAAPSSGIYLKFMP